MLRFGGRKWRECTNPAAKKCVCFQKPTQRLSEVFCCGRSNSQALSVFPKGRKWRIPRELRCDPKGGLESYICNGKASSILSSHCKCVHVPNNKIHLSLTMQERNLLKNTWPIRESPVDLGCLAEPLINQKQSPRQTLQQRHHHLVQTL